MTNEEKPVCGKGLESLLDLQNQLNDGLLPPLPEGALTEEALEELKRLLSSGDLYHIVEIPPAMMPHSLDHKE